MLSGKLRNVPKKAGGVRSNMRAIQSRSIARLLHQFHTSNPFSLSTHSMNTIEKPCCKDILYLLLRLGCRFTCPCTGRRQAGKPRKEEGEQIHGWLAMPSPPPSTARALHIIITWETQKPIFRQRDPCNCPVRKTKVNTTE